MTAGIQVETADRSAAGADTARSIAGADMAGWIVGVDTTESIAVANTTESVVMVGAVEPSATVDTAGSIVIMDMARSIVVDGTLGRAAAATLGSLGDRWTLGPMKEAFEADCVGADYNQTHSYVYRRTLSPVANDRLRSAGMGNTQVPGCSAVGG